MTKFKTCRYDSKYIRFDLLSHILRAYDSSIVVNNHRNLRICLTSTPLQTHTHANPRDHTLTGSGFLTWPPVVRGFTPSPLRPPDASALGAGSFFASTLGAGSFFASTLGAEVDAVFDSGFAGLDAVADEVDGFEAELAVSGFFVAGAGAGAAFAYPRRSRHRRTYKFQGEVRQVDQILHKEQ